MYGARITVSVYMKKKNAGCGLVIFLIYKRPKKENAKFHFIEYGNDFTLGPFIREKISRGLHKTRTPRINGTKSMFTAYSTQGQLKPRLILAEGFWDGLIQAAAYLGRESVRVNALKRCPRLAEAVNDCCACSVFNYIPDLHGRETRVAVAGK